MTISKKMEKRTVDITNIQTRNKENEPIKINGYAAIFNSRTSIGDFFDEIISPGAFDRSISAKNADIRALVNHDWDKVIGRTKANTMTLREDEKGLNFEIELPNTSYARDLAESMERGDIDQCSFGFFVDEGKERWDYSQEPALRTLEEVELYEVSIVSLPAYEDTEAALVRSKEIDKTVERRIKLIKQINEVLK
ncbi:HK97 family phage prohead protease [Lederbergia galactosidilyticus]|uniref:HK97 family phage prohead protease n=1 Tax=Lederbergia galactosidilytica TaxID=217031 RepID=UPI001AE3E66C|nr:HK97 family phage prohead protease [Lederbergia galactosidilytica]MBP1917191.1 HK97 family phage prohead protease [Lederbergia galactosidilytica]